MHKVLGVEAKLVPGRNGIFDVIVDGELVFSKFKSGRFPEPGEVAVKLSGRTLLMHYLECTSIIVMGNRMVAHLFPFPLVGPAGLEPATP